MTSHNDLHMWWNERKMHFLLKCQTSVRTTPCTNAFITLRDDHHALTDRNSLTGIGRQWVRNKFNKVLLHKLHPKCFKNVEIVVINNNFAPSIFRLFCEFIVDCFWTLVFLFLQKNALVFNNHLRFHTMTSRKMVWKKGGGQSYHVHTRIWVCLEDGV